MIRRLLLACLVLAVPAWAEAQAVEVTNITTSTSIAIRCVNTGATAFEGCGGSGATDTDDGSIAGGQTPGLSAALQMVWNSAAWVRLTLGQALMASSLPVAIASDQTAVPVSATNLDVQIGGSDTVAVSATNLDVQIGGSDTVTVSATNLDVQIGGSDTVTVTATNLDVQSGGADVLSTTAHDAAFGTAGTADTQVRTVQGIAAMTPLLVDGSATTQPVSGTVTVTDGAGALNTIIDSGTVTTVSTVTTLSQFAGNAINLGSGTIGTGTLRMNIATDDPVNDAAVELSAAIGATGAAVSASAVQIHGTDGTNAIVPWIDPCEREARTTYVVDIVTATTTEIANAVSSEFFFLCSVHLFSAGTNNVIIVEDDTDACTSPTAGLNGGTTAAEGYNFTAQTGIAAGDGSHYIMRTATANRYLCIITSAAVQLSGTITYVSNTAP